MTDLNNYKRPMQPIPEHLAHAIQRGVHQGPFPGPRSADRLFEQWARYADRVTRSNDGQVLVTCTSELPGVTPRMIDWWFGWHLPEAERYRLWHPEAHIKARVEEDRTGQPINDHDKYIDNISYVDEYIGKRRMRLAIRFFRPDAIGLGGLQPEHATAICAATSDRVLNADAGQLVHRVEATAGGSEMRSAFWLGDLHLNRPVIGALIAPILRTRSARRVFVRDRMALDLLRHCAEEMHHLARFLPDLYRAVNAESA
jgi:hypothetical protein